MDKQQLFVWRVTWQLVLVMEIMCVLPDPVQENKVSLMSCVMSDKKGNI